MFIMFTKFKHVEIMSWGELANYYSWYVPIDEHLFININTNNTICASL